MNNNGNTPEGAVNFLPGGAMRFAIGGEPSSDKPVSSGPSVTVHGGKYRVILGAAEGDSLSVTTPQQYKPSDDINGLGDWLETGKDLLTGKRITGLGDITDRTEFVINGVSMPATSAAHAGYLVKQNDGSYSLPVEANSGGNGDGNDDDDDDKEATVNHLSPSVRSLLDELDSRTGSVHATEAIVTSVILNRMTGDLEKATDAIVQRTGIDPDIASETMEKAYEDAYQSAANFVTENYGEDGEAVFEYIAATCPLQERASLAYRLYLGERRAFDDCVAKYRRAIFLSKCANNEALPEEGEE